MTTPRRGLFNVILVNCFVLLYRYLRLYYDLLVFIFRYYYQLTIKHLSLISVLNFFFLLLFQEEEDKRQADAKAAAQMKINLAKSPRAEVPFLSPLPFLLLFFFCFSFYFSPSLFLPSFLFFFYYYYMMCMCLLTVFI